MSKQRETFPPRTSSIGRVQGNNLQRAALLHQPIAAHPLLFTTPSTPASPDGPTTPKYHVPYTPRQRIIPTSPTTATAAGHSIPSSIAPAQNSGATSSSHSATDKLQLMTLKAAAQGLGLDTGSVGWAILEKLIGVGLNSPASDGEWADIWSAITVGKAVLLLPLEHITQDEHDHITPEFIKDHIVICEAAPMSSPTASVSCSKGMVRTAITLSGLRGVLDGDKLTLRSSLHTSSKLFQLLLDPVTRSSTLSGLPPLPRFPSAASLLSPSVSSQSLNTTSTQYPSESNTSQPRYPAYTLYSEAATQTPTTPTINTKISMLTPTVLPLPPRPPPPPLPPRPAPGINTSTNTNTNASNAANNLGATPRPASPSPNPALSTSRIAGFASLFGVKAAVPSVTQQTQTQVTTQTQTNISPPVVSSSSSSITASDVPGVRTLTSGSSNEGVTPVSSPIDIAVYAVSRAIDRDHIGRQIEEALRGEIDSALSMVGIVRKEDAGDGVGRMEWVRERVVWFIKGMFPLVLDESGKGAINRKGQGKEKGRGRDVSKAGRYVVNVFGESMEDLGDRFQDFYRCLEADFRAGGEEQRRREAEGGEKIADMTEGRLREIMEAVEKVITELFYDRLFLQPISDDPTHDEALASRVAALNILELGLEHLDVDVSSTEREGVDDVVKACGETLTQLDVGCWSPAAKAAKLVAAHKIIVDGLSTLPPVKLKSEDHPGSPDKSAKLPSLEMAPSEAEDEGEDDDNSSVQVDAPAEAPSPIASLVSSPTSRTPTVTTSDPPTKKPPPPPISSDNRNITPAVTASTPVSGDILLPLLIFSVVKANPPHLVSHLLYMQRFRNQSVGGEESYCMVNLMAVADFLENIDLGAVGLGDGDKKIINAAHLLPISITRTPESPAFPQLPTLRARVEQQVDALAGSANKVILGVVDSSVGILRSFLPGSTSSGQEVSAPSSEPASSAPWNAVKPGLGLLRRESGFSIASLAASLPGSKDRTKSVLGEETGQQLVSVSSKPGLTKSRTTDDDVTSNSDDGSGGDSGEEESESNEGGAGSAEMDTGPGHDARSIRSFESMMSSSARDRKDAKTRKSLSDRLAHMPGLSKLSHSEVYRESPHQSLIFPVPTSSRPHSPISLRLPPPNRRFIECHENDLKVSEVSELLREYKQLVENIRAAGGFDE